MKFYSIAYLMLVIVILTSCYNQRENINYTTFSEPQNPEQANSGAWEATGRGLHLSFGSKDVKYRKAEVPMVSVNKDQEFIAWKGERLSFQAVLWSSFDVKQVECEWSHLVSQNGDTIKKHLIETNFVRYIMSDDGYVNDESDNMAWRDSCLMPDMLDNLPCIDMEAQTVRPLWVTVLVPEDAKEGTYRASLKVFSKDNPPQELRVRLKVVDRTLPRPEYWRFQTNMSINPVSIAMWHNVPLWSEKHHEIARHYIELMKLSGQTVVNVSIFNQYNNSNQDAMIRWTKTKNGQMKADFSRFDEWIKAFDDEGINGQIDCFAFDPQGKNELSYYDEKSRELQVKLLNAYDDKELLIRCYTQVVQHLRSAELFEKSVFVIGGGESEVVKHLKQVIYQVDAEQKLELLAQEWSSGLMENVFAANVPSQFSNLKEWFKMRHQQGLETSFQVEAKDLYPNLCLSSPSAEASWLGWYALSQGIDGIHIENYNNWGDKPLTEARLKNKSSGSNFLIYPQARSSIRYERLIEGIQDFEKLLVLKESLQTKGDELSRMDIALIDEVLSDFVIDRIPRESAAQMVNNGQKLINEIVLK
ncbi:DUF4091 domain-containing protein [Carboxylicivirga marina]|uniref:DUF4091 domain-containing protein n=1 Tax=Carboxylicivirga marina TaxID=2800988 RepID=A0ABS1HLE8_9BACT|nr:DUF4091 domain-containing protein [Carboxylicivirga marina]MBK3518504.1 DUF4091 domain-containing protein [Carboxylicivirga marina]